MPGGPDVARRRGPGLEEDGDAIRRGYEYKAAIDGTWDENYGAGGVRGGSNVPLTVPAGGGTVTFYYDHASHWVTSDANGPVITLAGDMQSGRVRGGSVPRLHARVAC